MSDVTQILSKIKLGDQLAVEESQAVGVVKLRLFSGLSIAEPARI